MQCWTQDFWWTGTKIVKRAHCHMQRDTSAQKSSYAPPPPLWLCQCDHKYPYYKAQCAKHQTFPLRFWQHFVSGYPQLWEDTTCVFCVWAYVQLIFLILIYMIFICFGAAWSSLYDNWYLIYLFLLSLVFALTLIDIPAHLQVVFPSLNLQPVLH